MKILCISNWGADGEGGAVTMANLWARMLNRLYWSCSGAGMVVMLRWRSFILGDRRAEYDVDSGSELFVLFWALAAIAAKSVFFGSLCHWSDGIVVMMLSTAFFVTVFSTNGLRFVLLALPLLPCNLNLAWPTFKKGAKA